MDYLRKALRGTSIVFLMGIIGSILSYITLVYLARFLGPHDYGLFSAVLAFVTFFLFFRDFGLPQALTKYIAEYETTKKCYTIDYPKFKKLVLQKLTQSKIGLIIDSHIAHHLPKAMVDRCIVLTCSNLKELQKRLAKRKYSLRKIRENIDAEIFQVCLMEAKEKGHKILHQDTSATTKKKLLLEILKKI